MSGTELFFHLLDVVMHKKQNAINFDNIEIERDIKYSDDDEICKCDYYYRDKSAKKPVFIYIHGGGFVKGDKSHRQSLGEFFADKGYFVINANHRLAPKYTFPAPIEDIYNVSNFLTTISDEYNLDLNKVILSGDSSGGYMTAEFLATLFDSDLHDKLELPECKIKIAAYVGICPAYDLIKMMRAPTVPFGIGRKLGNFFLGMKLKRNYSNVEEFKYYKYLSPINFVNSSWCPCMMLYNTKDIFCYKQTEAMLEELKKYNVPYSEFSSDVFLENHCYQLYMKSQSSKIALDKTVEFLDKI
jgi:acetyl esterase/lipase